jgi:adenine-specific DNA glycosylase
VKRTGTRDLLIKVEYQNIPHFETNIQRVIEKLLAIPRRMMKDKLQVDKRKQLIFRREWS